MARPDDLHLSLRYFVPLVVPGRREEPLLAFRGESLPVAIRGVGPAEIEPRLLRDAGLHDPQVGYHRGRLWIPVEYAPPGRSPRDASLEEAAAVLSGTAGGGNGTLSPLRPVVHHGMAAPGGLSALDGGSLHPRTAARATMAFPDEARRRAASRASDELIHDGTRVLRAIDVPLIGHGASGVGYRSDVPGMDWHPLFAPTRLHEAIAAFARAKGHPPGAYGDAIARLAGRWSGALDGVDEADVDIRHFVREGTYALLRGLRRVRPNERHAAFDRAVDLLAPIAAKASIDAVADDLPRCVEAIRSKAHDVDHWIQGRRMEDAIASSDCRGVFLHARDEAAPALETSRHHPEDAGSLALLAP